MALIECKECGKQISSDAKSCPDCGKQLSKITLFGCMIALLGIVVAILVSVFGIAAIEDMLKGIF